jgi:myo-inositol 2-dehydrogenase / D-chiro-inositol 1-dehydrogenase
MWESTMSDQLRFGLIGTGWIGRFHAETLARRLPDATLVAVDDPNLEAAQAIGAPRAYADPYALIADPQVQAVAISSPAATHTDLVVAAAQAGKHVFCEKPMALTLADADRAIAAAADAGVALQVGFNRRFATDFAAAHDAIVAGKIGTPQLLRSLTRDPGISAEVAARVKPWTIFNETLIHDFDTLCWLNPGTRVTEVYAQAAALIHPQYADAGYLDTSVVQLRFDNGAFAVAEASFQAVYGYDVRGEVFGSDGVLLAGRAPADAGQLNIEMFHDAYVAQFADFVTHVRAGAPASVTGHDARVALEIALAAAESVRTGGPVELAAMAQA